MWYNGLAIKKKSSLQLQTLRFAYQANCSSSLFVQGYRSVGQRRFPPRVEKRSLNVSETWLQHCALRMKKPSDTTEAVSDG